MPPLDRRRLEVSSRDPDGTSTVGVARAFETFFEDEYRSVVALAYALSGSRSAAEDIAQEAFLAASRNWARISRYEQPAAWVRRVAANIAVSWFRRSMVEAKALARLASRREPAVEPIPAEDEAFLAAVRSLPKRQAQVITLYYLEDLAVGDVAAILRCAEGTVRAHLHKGRRNLARALRLDVETEP